MNSARLLLFDIDGTLISPGKTPRAAFIDVTEELTGIRTTLEFHHVAGLTDPAIVDDMLLRCGVHEDDIHRLRGAFFPLYFARMRERYHSAPDRHLFPEIPPLLDELSARDDVFLALVTGNMETSARIKLDPFDLNRYFEVGAFASDSPIRTELPLIAVRRAEDKWDRKFKPEDVVVIGDTAHDVHCAKHNGMISVAVARRDGDLQTLRDAGACCVYTALPSADSLISALE